MKFHMPARQVPKAPHNQTLHILDEQGRSLCQMENVARKKELRWVEVAEIGDRSVCKNCLTIGGDYLTAAFKATIN